jgi:hypothetical protein
MSDWGQESLDADWGVVRVKVWAGNDAGRRVMLGSHVTLSWFGIGRLEFTWFSVMC